MIEIKKHSYRDIEFENKCALQKVKGEESKEVQGPWKWVDKRPRVPFCGPPIPTSSSNNDLVFQEGHCVPLMHYLEWREWRVHAPLIVVTACGIANKVAQTKPQYECIFA